LGKGAFDTVLSGDNPIGGLFQGAGLREVPAGANSIGGSFGRVAGNLLQRTDALQAIDNISRDGLLRGAFNTALTSRGGGSRVGAAQEFGNLFEQSLEGLRRRSRERQ
jgi:hypothetical protein